MTWREDVRPKLARAETLPEAIRLLREAAGSHDKLADEIGKPATRQVVIRWEKGENRPTKPAYVEQLLALGVPPALLFNRGAVEKRLRQVEAEVAAIRRLL